MRVVAATFKDRDAAHRVLRHLRDVFGLGAKDAELAPLGTAGSEHSEGVTLLAGRFQEDRVPGVREVVEQNGGQVVVNVDEAATRRRATPPPASRPSEDRAEQRHLLSQRQG